jgi:hypothetical protein
LPPIALTLVGAPGTVAGVIELLVLDEMLVPAVFVAVTMNVYVVPLVRPVIVIGDEPPVAVKPPVLEVTVYPVIAEPPLLAGAENVIVAWPLLATADTLVGAPGTVAGVTELLLAEEMLVPVLFVAVTVNV